jgi:hypothetical protein
MTEPAGWLPIESAPDLPPRARGLVLGSFPKGLIAFDNPKRLDRDYWTTMDGVFHAPTHWHPLSEPPLS